MSRARFDSVLEPFDSGQQQQSEQSEPLSGNGRFAYITLLTRASYLAGVVVLAHTLRQQGSQYPLIVLYTPTLTQTALRALELEAKHSKIILKPCELLVPDEHHVLHVAVERFTDTWTKLRVFESFDYGYDTICYLDADMTILQNMDSVFNEEVPDYHIAAVHDCVCSPQKMEWTPEDHCPENCAFNASAYPEEFMDTDKEDQKPTYQLFNSGMFLFHPSEDLWGEMLFYFKSTDKLGSFRFPDQDFLTDFFRNRWMGLPWKYNAVKTMAYRHQNMWRQGEIVCMHYIVDKPWAKRIGSDGIAGFMGQDGETHQWWWDEFEAWFTTRQEQGEFEVVAIMAKHVARRESEVSDDDRPDMSAIGAKVHAGDGEEFVPDSMGKDAALGVDSDIWW